MMTGIFVSKGMTVAVPPGGFKIGFGDDGSLTSNLTLHLHFDVCPTWVQLSLRHLQDAMQRRAARQAAWSGTDGKEQASALEHEFEASMQAMMAAATAIDAFYSTVKTHVALPKTLIEQ